MYLAQGWRVVAILLFTLSVSSCGSALDALPGGKSGGSNQKSLPSAVAMSTISGVAQDGRVTNGSVRIYAFDGTKGEMLGSGSTDSNGRYSVAIQSRSQPVLVEISGGQYKEETTGTEVQIGDEQALYAVLLYETGKASSAVVSYYSTLAAGLAEYLIKTGSSPAGAISNANRRIAAILGIESLNVVPADITDPAEARPTVTSQLEFGFATAAVSSLTEVASIDNGAVPHRVFNSIRFIQAAYDDVRADGLLDGKGTTGVVSVGTVALTAARYRHELALHILRSATIEIANRVSLSPKSLLRVAESLNSSIDPIFGNAGIVALDSEVPNILSVSARGKELQTGALLFGTTEITASVMSLPGVDSVEVLLDGNVRGIARGQKNPRIDLGTADLPDGSHKLTVRVTDVVGGVGSSTFDVVVSNKQSTIKNISIANGDYLRGRVQVTADITDPIGVTNVEYSVDGRVVASTADAQAGFLLNAGVLSDGSHTVTIAATNAAGNIFSADVQFFSDKTNPEISILNPPPGSAPQNTFLRSIFNLEAMVTDLALGSAEVFVGGSRQLMVSMPSLSVPIDTASFLDGENTLVVRAVDKAGNSDMAERRVVFDNTPPAITLLSPASGATVGGARQGGVIEIQAIASDSVSGLSNALIRISNAQGFEQSFPLDPSDSIERVIDSTRLGGDGPYQISIMAADRAGNLNDSVSVGVVVDNIGPSLNLSLPTVRGTLRGQCVISGRVVDSGGVASVMFRLENASNQDVDPSLDVDRAVELGEGGSFEFSIQPSDSSTERFSVSLVVSASDPQENKSVATRALEFLVFERARTRNRIRERLSDTTDFEPEFECSFQ